jgi:hypothetical protein
MLRRLLRLSALIAIVASAAPVFALNPIQIENSKPGTPDWILTKPHQYIEIEGYASATSINRGGSISFFVRNLVSTSYTLEVFRVGWYGGMGGRRMVGPIVKSTVVQPDPTADADGMKECNWIDPFVLTVPRNLADPSDWASGVYLVKLTENGYGNQAYIIFTVRDDDRVPAATYLFQSSVNTWQAYNPWGNRSLYDYNSSPGAARKVSFNRPYIQNYGAGDFLGNNYYGWEVNMLRFLEKEGYDVGYTTSVDVHAGGTTLLKRHRAFLSVGHDEYWSYQMKQAVQSARDMGTNLGFFASNVSYWQIRYQAGGSPAVPNRTIVAYKEAAQTSDPYWLDSDPTNDKYITTRFRDIVLPPFNVRDPVAQPENGLIGVMYHGDPVCCNIVVSDATSWVFAGTGIANGTTFYGLLGYEADAKFDNGFQPRGLATVTASPDSFGTSHGTTYLASSGATVFATGSMQWSWGLDDYNTIPVNDAPAVRPSFLDPVVMAATRNVLARLATLGVAAPQLNSVAKDGKYLKLSWKQSSTPAIALNRIYRSTQAGGPYVPIATIAATTSYTDPTIVKNVMYYYEVSALNGSGLESAPSAEISADR